MEPGFYQNFPEPMPRVSFWKTISLVVAFALLTPVALSVSAFSLLFLSANAGAEAEPQVLASQTQFGANIYAALPDSMPSVASSIGIEDARVEIVKKYLLRYNSPLTPYAEHIVSEADKNGIDFRLTTAIAQQESNLCKFIPEGTYNCWGWGIHSRGTLGFSSYKEGISVVSGGLKRDYINRGLHTPEEIMSRYTPLSNGSWAHGVRAFMHEMR